MDKRNSLNGRFSLSTTNIASPIAESTQINGSSVQGRFLWGGSTISPRKTLPTNSGLTQSHMNTSVTSNAQRTNTTTNKVSMSPINKIDPRVYTDIQSNGLASRIVKYHENSTRLNRSQSTGNLYNKPGQFPVVHLKKVTVPKVACRSQNLSMVRIAPPDKTVFHGNTLSSILRSGSVVPSVGLQKISDNISHENLPILHPPATEKELAPTRSVLEVLKEISRKRINSDEADCNDSVKKYCKEYETETPRGNNKNHVPHELGSNSVISKRQREVPASPNAKSQTSPTEQGLHKRLCSRNNDITSSLSSSLFLATPKRKLQNFSSTSTSSKSSPDVDSNPPRAKQLCNDSNYAGLAKLTHSLSDCPITPLPPTPAIAAETSYRCAEPMRTASEPIFSLATNETKASHTNKPKLTLFNKDYEPLNQVKRKSRESSPALDDCCSGIQFVKPKKSSSISSIKNPLIERTQKSKLALMLSGLRGDLDGEDEVDASAKKSQEIAAVSIPTTATLSFGTSTTTVTSTISSPIIAPRSESKKKSETQALTAASVPTSVPASVKSSTSTAPIPTFTPPVGGFKLTSQPGVTTPVISASMGGLSAKPTDCTTITKTRATGEFSFGSPKPITSTIASAALPTAPKTFSFGTPNLGAMPAATSTNSTGSTLSTTSSTLSSVQPSNVSSSTVSFGSPSSHPTLTLGTSKSPPTADVPASTFSTSNSSNAPTFGASPTGATFGSLSSAVIPPPAAAKPAPPSFGATFNTLTSTASTFGAVTTAPFGSLSSAPTTAKPPPPSFTQTTATQPTFGTSQFGASAVASTTATAGTTNTSFSFGNANKDNASNNAISTFGNSTHSTSQPASGGFSFGTTSLEQKAAPTQFSFGSVASKADTTSSTAPTSTDFAFSATTVAKPATGGFSFGSAAASPPTTISPFGSAAADNKTSVISFGGATTTKAATINNTPAPRAGGFAFGGATPGNEGDKNIFGAPVATAKPASFSFGGSTPSASGTSDGKASIFGAPSKSEPISSLFGGAKTNGQSTSTFSFGSNSHASSNTPSAIANLFGGATAAQSNNNTPSLFGAASAVPATASNNNAASLFGAASSVPATASNNNTASLFGAASPVPATASNKTTQFAFGGSRPAEANTSSMFSFGANSSTSTTHQSTSTPKAAPAYTFGSTSNQSSNEPGSQNLFANASKPAAFNFTGGGGVASSNVFGGALSSSSQSVPASNNNLFSAAPAPAQPGERHIRRATRRLQK